MCVCFMQQSSLPLPHRLHDTLATCTQWGGGTGSLRLHANTQTAKYRQAYTHTHTCYINKLVFIADMSQFAIFCTTMRLSLHATHLPPSTNTTITLTLPCPQFVSCLGVLPHTHAHNLYSQNIPFYCRFPCLA